MKVIQTKNNTALVELSYSELNTITRLYKDDIEKICRTGEEINLVKTLQHYANDKPSDLKASIDSLEGALKFLTNRYNSIKGT